MKWLYKILRLFFCPHKYVRYERVRIDDPESGEYEYREKCSCVRCGKMRRFKR